MPVGRFGCVQMEQVLRVERLRQAVLENLRVDFAKPLLPGLYAHYPGPYGPGPGHGPGHNHGPGIYAPGPMYRGRGGPMGPLPPPPGPKSPGRGRGILGNIGNNPFCY